MTGIYGYMIITSRPGIILYYLRKNYTCLWLNGYIRLLIKQKYKISLNFAGGINL
jgi:hypothetical protein